MKQNRIRINGIDTWYGVVGEGEPLLMLHPGGTDARSFEGLLPTFQDEYKVYLPERRGHGRTPDVDGPLRFEDMVDDTVAFIEQVVGGPVRVFGYSDGALVGIMLAAKRPDLVTRLVCACGVSHHDGWLPGVIDVNNEPPEFMAKAYGEVSPDGEAHYEVVTRKLTEAHLDQPALTAGDLGNVRCRTMVIIGDDDEVRLEHAVDWYRALPDGELAVVPRTSHALMVEKPELFLSIVTDFFKNDPVQTYAPIRRRR